MTRGSMTAMVVLAVVGGALSTEAGLAADVSDGEIARARGAVKQLSETLKGKLMAAMSEGGPVAAIPVCQIAAPGVAQDVGAANALGIRRTSLKVRNPANAPEDWERAVLEDFAAKMAAGADPATLEAISTGTADGTPELRYMKAIPMAEAPCAACHGGAIAPAVLEAIAKLYPEDQATGFKPGELRGAFSVRVPLAK